MFEPTGNAVRFDGMGMLDRIYHKALPVLRTARLYWRVLFLAGLFTAPAMADPPVPEKVRVAVLGAVVKPGVYLLESPVTIEAAFQAAGGCHDIGSGVAKYCTLDMENKHGETTKIKITVKVDRASKSISWQTVAPSSTLCEVDWWLLTRAAISPLLR